MKDRKELLRLRCRQQLPMFLSLLTVYYLKVLPQPHKPFGLDRR